ncbi:MAG: tRNA (adenosine(37)-N6)-dimethylallyltransferase MiaA [Clostridia bacterium]|nr:tRNA (adenosine(37)-N6)-dimethylallyltransferase MiaA [Clostridia bacterium]
MKPKVIVIVGPTASGKTALSIELAKKINGEIVSCDSMQIYKDMDIGSAKPSIEEMQGIKHYMIDIATPNERFSVAEYKKLAESAIDEILSKGKIPIVVGGTGLYADSLIYGIEYPEIEFDEKYREVLEKQAKTEVGLKDLYNQAKKIDELAVQKISENDKKRIIRILEIYHQTGKTKTELEIDSRKNEVKYDFKVFAINMERQILYDRINKRVDIMIKNGLIQEVENLLKKYNQFPTAMQGLGYKEVVQYLNKELTKEEMIDKIKLETRRYAKRQLTWFRKNKETIWIDGLVEVQNNIDVIFKHIQ